MVLFDRQPGKAVWTLGAITINLAKFPFWVLYYLPSFTRPHKSWSLQQAIRVHIVKLALWHMAWVKLRTPLSLKPGAEKDRWVIVRPAGKKSYVGPAIADRDINPQPVGGTWYPAAPTKGKQIEGYVVLHLHGGAYMIGDGRTHDAGFAAKTLLAHTDATHIFAPQYRLSCNADCRFPAALQDAITTYTYLVSELDIAPSRIVVSGDSAGGNLVLALLRYISEHGEVTGLQAPACAWLWSPWVSPARSLDTAAFNASPNVATDYVSAGFGGWGAYGYQPAQSTGLDLRSPYCCFYDNVFATTTPLYISTGECEVLLHDNVKLAEDFRSVKGNRVELQIEEHAVHDIILAGNLVGFEREAELAAKRAGEFAKSL